MVWPLGCRTDTLVSALNGQSAAYVPDVAVPAAVPVTRDQDRPHVVVRLDVDRAEVLRRGRQRQTGLGVELVLSLAAAAQERDDRRSRRGLDAGGRSRPGSGAPADDGAVPVAVGAPAIAVSFLSEKTGHAGQGRGAVTARVHVDHMQERFPDDQVQAEREKLQESDVNMQVPAS